MITHNSSTVLSSKRSLVFFVVFVALVIGAWIGFFVWNSQKVLGDRFREVLLEHASLASLQFDAAQLERIQGSEDVHSNLYKSVVSHLQAVRGTSPLIESVYIMRRTDNPDQLSFVADADASLTPEQLDTNHNGSIDPEEQVPVPGELYDVSNIPALRDLVWSGPVADREVTVDQWGSTISGYAPIYDENHQVVAAIGIDMDAQMFNQLQNVIFSPVVLFISACSFFFIAAVLGVWGIRRRLRMREELDRERSALMDLLLHQLGAPIATFRWWLDIFGERDADGKDKDIREQLAVGLERMSGIMKALMEASNAESGSGEMNKGVTPLRKTVQTVVSAALPHLKHDQKISLSLPDEECNVRLDPKSFTAIVSELLDNASTYSPEATTIDVIVSKQDRTATVEVRDRGYGIPAEEIAHLPQKFKRGSNANKYKPVGNGLGLFIVHGILEHIGGKLNIVSQLDSGTSVSLMLPLLPAL